MKQVCILLAWLCLSGHVCAQYSLRGTVTNQDKEHLTGANVVIRNTYYQTITDNTGAFVFTGLKPGMYFLQVSYVGFVTFFDTITLKDDSDIMITMQESTIISDEVVISAVRASQNTPATFTLMDKAEINRRNLAQDLPYMLNLEPSVVTTSDAGAGVGYTSMRIRGSDITRINVTINGIPLNDPESHVVYWVDIPDFASSVNSLQLQRGVGSSTNGAGAFGASMNLATNTFQSKPFGMFSVSGGSFNTWKTSFQAGTGLINNHWYFDGRGSAIGSDGYIERASSSLSSFFIQGGYCDDKTLIKAIIFGGKEKTYQAWYGTSADMLRANRRFNGAGAIYDESWNVIDYYDNQSDNYQQNHYQLHISRSLTHRLSMNLSGHYTYGRGYYEEYKQDELFTDYGLDDLYFGPDSIWTGSEYRHFYHDTLYTTDLIRRRWLDNHFYGLTWSLRHQTGKTDLIIGGAFNKYDRARHFGEIIWAEHTSNGKPGDEYYSNTSFKDDLNMYIKLAWSALDHVTFYGDMQFRNISYDAGGIESHLDPVNIRQTFNFLNPKVGASYNLKVGTMYISYGIAHREPIRDDYIDALPGEKPKPETLGNLELGIRKTTGTLKYNINYFLMNYVNQLVLTGEINDDGAYIRKNSGKSYRTGIEISAACMLNTLAEVRCNLTLSMNKTDYKQVDSEGTIKEYANKDISFSPRTTAGIQFRLCPVRNLEFNWMSKYVGKQFLDNTGNKELMLKSYLVNDLRLAYLISREKLPEVECTFLLNNLFNNLYESNGSVYDGTPYYYPQAGINFLAGLNVKF